MPEARPAWRHGRDEAHPDPSVVVIGSGDVLARSTLESVPAAGATFHRAPDGRLLAMAFRGHAVDLGQRNPPQDDDALADIVLQWIEAVRTEDWEALRGSALEGDEWTDLRTAMVRVGWGPRSALAAWRACRSRPYHRDLPTAAGWAGGGWVVPAVPSDLDPAFATPVLESRGLLRWAYISRWRAPAVLSTDPGPNSPVRMPPVHVPLDLDPLEERSPLVGTWSDVLSRFRADHYTEAAVEEAEQLAVEVLHVVGLGPQNVVEADDEPLPERDVEAACTHPSPVVRAAAWFLLRREADTWVACTYGECQHHWAVEAEEDAYEHAEVLELAAHGVASPVDAALVRRRLLSEAFGDINDVPLAGASDPGDFITFYNDWVAGGRSPDEFEEAVRALRGDT